MAKVPEEVLERIDWGRTFKRLTAFAYHRLGDSATHHEAEDIAAQAIRQLLDPKYAEWDHEHEPITVKLGSIVNGLVRNRNRVKATTAVEPVDFMTPAMVRHASSAPGAEAIADAAAAARRAIKLIEDEIRDDHHCEAIFLLECDGVSEPTVQAEALAVAIGIIYKARFKLKQARTKVRSRMREEGWP